MLLTLSSLTCTSAAAGFKKAIIYESFLGVDQVSLHTGMQALVLTRRLPCLLTSPTGLPCFKVPTGRILQVLSRKV